MSEKKEKTGEQKECLLTGALNTLLRVSRIIGVAPIQLERKTESYWLSVSSNIYTIQAIFTTLLLTVAVATMPRGTQDTTLIWYCINFEVLIAAGFAVYNSPARMRAIIHALNRIQKVNSSIGCQQNILNEQKKSVAIIGSTVYLISCITLINPWNTSKIDSISNAAYYTSLYYTHVMLFMVKLEFALCNLELISTMSSINDLLEFIRQTNLHGIAAEFKTNHSCNPIDKTVHLLATSYYEVFQVIGLLDAATGPIILLMLISCFSSLVYIPYTFITMFGHGFPDFWTPIWMIQWISINVFWLLLIIEPCHKIQMESDRAHVTTSTLLLMCEDRLILKELENLSLNFLLTDFSFSPMSICRLSHSLLTNIAVSIILYLITMVQF